MIALHFFIKHVYQRYTTASSVYSRDSITTLTNDENKTMYLIRSETDVNKKYCVDFSPSCTCYDFLKYRFPRKHILAVIIHVPDTSFYDSSLSYRNSPFLTIEPEFSVFESNF